MFIRREQDRDIDKITEITIAAFKNLSVSNQTEHFIVKALRNTGELALSLVAEEKGEVVGHIAFSPVKVTDGSADWYGVGPLSVAPECQKRGIGSALINQGITELKKMGGRGCALVGYPAFYNRFGFKNYPECIFEGIPQEFFMVLPFYGEVPRGKVIFSEAFMVTA